MFIVFSQRHKKDIENKTLKVTMPMQIREQTLKVKKYYQTWYETNETGWNYSTSIEDEVLSDLKVFYKLKAYNYKNDLVEVKDFDSFYLRCYPAHTFDVLEKFNSYCNNDEFCKDINDIFKINDYSYVIINSKIIKIDSTFLDEQGIEKLSYLLKNDTDFSQTLKHYNDSINNFQSNNFDSAITEGNRFFESLLMNITNQKKLNNQKDLKKKLMSLGIFPDYSQNI